MKQIPVKLAPLAEQKRIVDAIEAQFTRLDAAVTGLQRLRANLQRYRQSVLKAACEGRLVPTEAELARAEDRPFEDGAALLQRILAERRRQWEADNRPEHTKNDKWKDKYSEPAAPDVSSLPDLPDGWFWATVEQVINHITSGSRGWAKYYSSEGVVFIRAQDIKTDKLDLTNVAYVNIPSTATAEARRTQVFQDDLLITITGANVTKTALVTKPLDDAYVNQHVAIVRPVFGQLAPYLYCWIVSSAHGRADLERDAYGAGKPGLNLTNILEVKVALPPLAEQERIVEEVERRLSVIEQHEQVIAASLKRAERLRQSILKRAFAGQLV